MAHPSRKHRGQAERHPQPADLPPRRLEPPYHDHMRETHQAPAAYYPAYTPPAIRSHAYSAWDGYGHAQPGEHRDTGDYWRPPMRYPSTLPPFPPTSQPLSHSRQYHHSAPTSSRSSPAPSLLPDRHGSPPRSWRPGHSPQPSASPAPTLPSAEYVRVSEQPVDTSAVVPKLLVLDLNGALIHRSSHTGDRRKSHPRPYLRCFLEYLFRPDPAGFAEQAARPWDVFVWSSAQPHNVRRMVEDTFGEDFVEGVWEDEDEAARAARLERGEGRLLGVWARDMMGLDSGDYRRKVQTVKDLRKVIKHVDGGFDEKTTVLLDDSPLKAVHQPWSQIVITEYDQAAHRASKAAAAEPDTPDSAVGLDETLLAVVGILEALRTVDNVPAWVRAGGLVRRALELGAVRADALPSAEAFAHWHAEPRVFAAWADEGRAALARKGIELRHGVVPEPAGRARTSQTRSPEPRERAGWSPSRPAETDDGAGWSPSRPAETLDEIDGGPPDAHVEPRRAAPSSPGRAHPDRPASRPAPADTGAGERRRLDPADVAMYLEAAAETPQTADSRATLLAAANILRSTSEAPPHAHDPDASREGAHGGAQASAVGPTTTSTAGTASRVEKRKAKKERKKVQRTDDKTTRQALWSEMARQKAAKKAAVKGAKAAEGADQQGAGRGRSRAAGGGGE